MFNNCIILNVILLQRVNQNIDSLKNVSKLAQIASSGHILILKLSNIGKKLLESFQSLRSSLRWEECTSEENPTWHWRKQLCRNHWGSKSRGWGWRGKQKEDWGWFVEIEWQPVSLSSFFRFLFFGGSFRSPLDRQTDRLDWKKFYIWRVSIKRGKYKIETFCGLI